MIIKERLGVLLSQARELLDRIEVEAGLISTEEVGLRQKLSTVLTSLVGASSVAPVLVPAAVPRPRALPVSKAAAAPAQMEEVVAPSTPRRGRASSALVGKKRRQLDNILATMRRPLPRSTNQIDADEIAFMAFWEGRPRWKSILEQAEMPKQMKDLSVTTDMPAYAVAKVCRMLRLYGMIQRSKMKGDYPLWALTLTGVKAKERLNHLSSMTAQA